MMESRPSRVIALVHFIPWLLLIVIVLSSFTLIVLNGLSAHGFQADLHCSIPDKLQYNLALAIITFICSMTFCFVGLFLKPTLLALAHKKWWISVAGLVIFTILWLAAVSTAWYSCADLCNACESVFVSGWVTFAGKCCNCAGILDGYNDYCDNGIGGTIITGVERAHGWYHAAQGMDMTMFVLLLLLLVYAAVKLRVYARQTPSPQHHGPNSRQQPPTYIAEPAKAEYNEMVAK